MLVKGLSGRRVWPAEVRDIVALGGQVNELVTVMAAPASKQSANIVDGVPTSV